jgi:fatty-acyl-CoA synthase
MEFATFIDHHARQRPDALALRLVPFEGATAQADPAQMAATGTLSYRRLAERVRQCAQALAASGIACGDRVASLGWNHPDQIVLLLALARLGGIWVPLNYRLAQDEWAGVLADCQPQLIVADAHWLAHAQALAARMMLGCTTLQAVASGKPLARPLSARRLSAGTSPVLAGPNSPVLLVYTSGTTGQPKGALHTQGNLWANMQIVQAAQSLLATDLIASMLPLFHVGGLCIQTLPALGAGACVLLHARFDAQTALACIGRDKPTLTLQVPATLRALLAHPAWPHTDLRSLRAVWAGSQVLPPDVIAAFAARKLAVCNVYGTTETGPFSIALGSEHSASHAGSCGWPAPGVQVRLANAHCSGDGQTVGELCIRAPNVVTHYWPHQSALDAQGFFHTGDLATQAADGSYTVVGRVKDMIISGGENIYPAELENLLLSHPKIADCAAVGMPDAQWGEVVVAVVVMAHLAPQGTPSEAANAGQAALELALSDWLQSRIARYKQPRRWVWMSSLPKTALGKVQKHLLREGGLI